nr:N-acetylmuramoyl-L-alanine amidase [Lachnospiraceae bacterium]
HDAAMYINLPEGVDYAETSAADLYALREIMIKIPGDHMDFYEDEANLPTYKYKKVSDVEARYNENFDRTELIIYTDYIQGFSYTLAEKTGEEGAENDVARLEIGNPGDFYENIVVLDPGHGGSDPGTTYGKYKEKEINMNMATYLGSYLTENGTKVYMTRSGDVLIDLYKRAEFAFEVEADMFVSLHVNAAGWSNSSANGAGVYYCDSNISKNANGVTGKEIAEALSKDCTDSFDLKKNWGALKGNFVVIREARVPAVLVEIGFLSSSYDRPKITKASLQKKAARAMGKSIVKLLNK